jgi:hypothetical protein
MNERILRLMNRRERKRFVGVGELTLESWKRMPELMN